MPPSPSLRLIDLHREVGALPEAVRSVALIGNYPPRRCGIATFTADVRDSLLAARPGIACDVYAMTDAPNRYAYPDEVQFEIRQQTPADYLAGASRLSETQPDVICVEHEFGIFGGPAGEHLMLMLDAVDRPVVSTLHTVLERPDEDQRRVFERLLARSRRLVVMAERGRKILREVWRVDDAKIAVIPHGAPDRALSDPAPFKAKLGFADHALLFTFGLLSPNKGIETVIRALPDIVAARPDALYVVLGATHPHLIAREGERYRQSLRALADELGVGAHLQLVDAYTDTDLLVDYLQAADVYVTPYLNPAQITSGTLSYAAALGKPIVSTPYWHAEELLAGGAGRLVPFGDSAAFAAEITGLLCDDAGRAALRRRVYQENRGAVWSAFATNLLAEFDAAKPAVRTTSDVPKGAARPAPSLAALRRMTDSCGMLQHSLFDIPDRRHGYCVDDNARALILTHRVPDAATAERRSLSATYAGFVQHAWNDDTGRFRNFMSYERHWLEAVGSEDSTGRAALSVALSLAEGQDLAHRRWAKALMGRVLPHLAGIGSPRANAFILIGLAALSACDWNREAVGAMAEAKLADLVALRRDRRRRGQPWFEAVLSYDNARLPEALIRAGTALDDPGAVALGLDALEWLCRRQTAQGGQFLPVATADFGQPLSARSMFDQQPLEAAATIEACEAAYVATGDPGWIAEAHRAYGWYLGANVLGVPLATPDGECFDGLTWEGPNENKGAESVLSFQSAACALLRLTAAGPGALKTAGDR
jgi:glycosyltransferase involved in cell wall biosynthesis